MVTISNEYSSTFCDCDIHCRIFYQHKVFSDFLIELTTFRNNRQCAGPILWNTRTLKQWQFCFGGCGRPK